MPDFSEKARRDLVCRCRERAPSKLCDLGSPDGVAWAIEDELQRGEEVDWWAAGEPRR